MTKPVVAVASCLAYSFSSITMVLTNKSLVSAFGISLPVCLLLYQNAVAVAMLQLAKLFKIVDAPSFDVEVAIKWLPVNLVFVFMLSSGFFSLQYLAVPMITIFKNAANIIVVAGEYYILLEPVSNETVYSLILIVVSSLCGALFDLSFNVVGYVWMFVNCCATAAYVLYMRWASQHVRLTKFGMVFYNNLLSLPILMVVVVLNGEWISLMEQWDNITWTFLAMATFSGMIGFLLSLASFWCVGVTSATTYAVVGAMNKIPLTLLSTFLFGAHVSIQGAGAIFLSLLAGLLYSYAKIKESRDRRRSSESAALMDSDKKGSNNT